MNDYYTCTLRFSTRYADFDFQDDLKLSSFLNFMQEAAGISANELGCGSKFLWPKKMGFILTHNYLEIYKTVLSDEILTVKTWPLPPGRIIFERHYELYNKAGEKVAAAVSRWCLLDLQNKKFISSDFLEGQDYSIYNPSKTIDFKNWKIQPVPIEAKEPSYIVKVGNADCDHYRHVNNTRYADFCMNCFTSEELKNVNIRSFQINYEDQCVEGEILRFYRIAITPNEYIFIGLKSNEKRFLQAKIIFSNK